jgi:hypothetical protein
MKRGLPAKARLTFSGAVEETLTLAVVFCSEGRWMLCRGLYGQKISASKSMYEGDSRY